MDKDEYKKEVEIIEDVLRQQHLKGSVNFREMAIAVLAALSIKYKKEE